MFIQSPFQGIILNIFSGLFQFMLGANHMFIIAALPELNSLSADCSIHQFCGEMFEISNDLWKCRCIGRIWWAGRPGPYNLDNNVNVIWHYYTAIDQYMRILFFEGGKAVLNYLSDFIQHHHTVSNAAKNIISVLGTYRYEIESGLRIVESL